MDRIRAAGLGHADHLVNAQIGGNRPQILTDAVGLIRFETVQAQLVFLRENGDRFLAHLVGGPHDADGDFTTVGDKDLAEFGH